MSEDLVRETEHFRLLCRTINDLQQAQGLLDWDQQTYMPRLGAEQRSHQLAALATVIHERVTAPQLGEVMATLSERPELEAELQADLREMGRERLRAMRLSPELVAHRARVCARAQSAWEEAFQHHDFELFRPHLDRVVQVVREVASAIKQHHATAYDVLLEEYEPGTTEQQLQHLFHELSPPLRDLLERIAASTPSDPSVLRGHFPVPEQQAFLSDVARRMGFDLDRGRIDRSVHPFTAGTMHDVRITNRYREDNVVPAVFGMIHEAGHGLYEQGLDPARYRDPSGGYCSLGIHESQSRLWENLIGRSRSFWEFHLPLLQRRFPALAELDLDRWYAAINAVRPSLIRVDADEVTYNLHVVLRFQLERAIIGGDLQVADLPGAWRDGMQQLLGLSPTSDHEGVLQDVHWSAGLFGYFPTYALGNLYAAQFLEAMRRDLTELDRMLAAGELQPIRHWLNQKIHRAGRRSWPLQLCQQVTGETLTPAAALRHLERKYGDLYRL